ncbi:GNAT family N-acetyltransferase [Streptomyces griseoluteus]|uniref:GNAT family N-acetyltransferase n=1 Tax=Streptomyces griseoluteus TaxID=29306 RepID=UPI0037F1744D
MKVTAHEISITQRYLWRSAREAIPVQHALIVEVEQNGISGFGEASAFMTTHYNSDLDRMHADLRRLAPVLSGLEPEDPFAVWKVLVSHLPDSPFILAALDTAVHDLRARLLGVPLWQALGLEPPTDVRSSFSIGLDETDVMVTKLRERPGWPAYKVKLADPGDLSVLKELRRHTDAPFYVDGNCGWDLAGTLPALEGMRELGVELVEQPFARSAWQDAQVLKEAAPIPVIADESITSLHDLDACAAAFHGINVKPMKAGGTTPALALLRSARERGLRTMLGCMPESAAGLSATGHLASLADYLDVDSVVLNAVDTGQGIGVDAVGRVTLPGRPGSGFRPDPAEHGWRVRPVDAEVIRPVRHQVLRPGEPAENCAYAEDGLPGARHFAALRAGRAVGACSLYDEDPPEGRTVPGLVPGTGRRLRGMATLEEARGTGLGAALLRTALTHAVLDGADVVWCNARTDAAGFYRRHGFRVAGDPFEMPGIGPHLFMHWSPR